MTERPAVPVDVEDVVGQDSVEETEVGESDVAVGGDVEARL